MKNITSSLIVIPISVGAVAVILGLSVLWYGFVLSTLWGWFVVGQFGLPVLGILESTGVATVIRFMTYVPDLNNINKEADSESKTEKYGKLVGIAFIYPLMILVMAWVLHLFL